MPLVLPALVHSGGPCSREKVKILLLHNAKINRVLFGIARFRAGHYGSYISGNEILMRVSRYGPSLNIERCARARRDARAR